MPPMSAVKLVKYDEDGWTDKRAKTLEKIKDLTPGTRAEDERHRELPSAEAVEGRA